MVRHTLALIAVTLCACGAPDDIVEQDTAETLPKHDDIYVEQGGGNAPYGGMQAEPLLPEEVCMDCPAQDWVPGQVVLPQEQHR